MVLPDDMGYADIGPFGSEIPTPALQRLADEGFATVANSDHGFPGVRLALGEDVSTLAEVLHGAGYATAAVRKWHLTSDSLIHEGAANSSWPVQRGFDHYYGSLEGLNSFFHPNQIVRDNTVVQVEVTPEDYYITDDYTDEALRFIQGTRTSTPQGQRPFYLYFAHTAMHGPLGAKDTDLTKHRGRYSEGWDVLRRERHARQIDLGIMPPETLLPESVGRLGKEVIDWESWDGETKNLYARYQEVYAAMVDSIDQSLS